MSMTDNPGNFSLSCIFLRVFTILGLGFQISWINRTPDPWGMAGLLAATTAGKISQGSGLGELRVRLPEFCEQSINQSVWHLSCDTGKQMKYRISFYLLALAASLSFLLAVAMPAAPVRAQSIAVSPVSGFLRTKATVTGTGFNSGDSADVYLYFGENRLRSI